MIETFSYRIETSDTNYQQTIYSVDIASSVKMWLQKIEDLQDQSYSFDKKQVDNISQQYLARQLRLHIDKPPFFLTYKNGDEFQVVHIDKVSKSEPDFIAQITYLATENGGRNHYAPSGYRAQVKFDGKNVLTSGEQIFIDRDKVFPGETVITEIRLLRVNLFVNFLYVGKHFEISEAGRLVGQGEIVEIVNPNLAQASR